MSPLASIIGEREFRHDLARVCDIDDVRKFAKQLR